MSHSIDWWQSWLYERLLAYEVSGRKALHPTLAFMQAWDTHLDYPHRSYPIIHIAGTNGKGSTAAFLASILQWAGYKVGYHTSPHFIRFTERMRVNGKEPPEDWVNDFLTTQKNFITLHNLSFFEVTVGMSLAWFREAGVDIAIVEVGLGGRWDATNVIPSPLVSVITPIDWDHAEILGPTLRHIAREKAGIIKPGRPVVIASTQPPDAIEVFYETAATYKAPLYQAEKPLLPLDWVLEGPLPYRRFLNPTKQKLYLSDLPGDYQAINIQTALMVISCLRQQGWTISEEAIQKGLQHAAQTAPLWGRTQWVFHEGVPVLLEVAHNPQGFSALQQLLENAPYRPEIFIVGFSSDKDYARALTYLQGMRIELWAVAARNPRALAPTEIVRTAQELGLMAKEKDSGIPTALKEAIAHKKPIAVTGSIFVVAEALSALQTGPYEKDSLNASTPGTR